MNSFLGAASDKYRVFDCRNALSSVFSKQYFLQFWFIASGRGHTSHLTRVGLSPGDSWEWPKYVSYQSENCPKQSQTDKLADVLWLSGI